MTYRREELVGEMGVLCQDVSCQVKVLREKQIESSSDINTILMKDRRLSAALCVCFQLFPLRLTPHDSKFFSKHCDSLRGPSVVFRLVENADTVPHVTEGGMFLMENTTITLQ